MSGTNGIWTGHDWVDSTNGVEVNNGVPQGITDVMKRRIESTATYQGSVSEQYMQQPNVQLVSSFLTKQAWLYLFPMSIELYQYENFLQAVALYPKFCGEGTPDPDGSFTTACKREVATLFAHMTRESGFDDDKLPIEKWRQGLHWVTENACTPPADPPNPDCDYESGEGSWATTAFPPAEDQ